MTANTSLAPLLERFFTQRLMQQRLPKPPSRLRFAEIDAPLIVAFLDHLEQQRGLSVRSRNLRLTAIHSFFRYAAQPGSMFWRKDEAEALRFSRQVAFGLFGDVRRLVVQDETIVAGSAIGSSALPKTEAAFVSLQTAYTPPWGRVCLNHNISSIYLENDHLVGLPDKWNLPISTPINGVRVSNRSISIGFTCPQSIPLSASRRCRIRERIYEIED